MTTVANLRWRATRWHASRFPEAEQTHVALKLCEEAGEVGRAVNATCGKNSATGDGQVGSECADVVIAMLVLLGRFYPEVDLLAEVAAKLAILEDPLSGHRAAALAHPEELLEGGGR